MKNLSRFLVGLMLNGFFYGQSFAANPANESSKIPSAVEEHTGDAARAELSSSSQSQVNTQSKQLNKSGTAKNVQGRDGKVPTESSKNSRPSELKTQERTETVE